MIIIQIKLKPTFKKDVNHRLIKEFNKHMTNTKLNYKFSFHSGQGGIVFSFKHKSDEFEISMMIDKKSISFTNFIIKTPENWSNISVNIKENIKTIIFDDRSFKTLDSLYEHLMENYCELLPFNTELQITSDERTEDIDYFNTFIKKAIAEKTLYQDDTIDLKSYSRIHSLFAENDDTTVTFLPVGKIHIESRSRKIDNIIKLSSTSETCFKTNTDTALLSYNDVVSTLFSDKKQTA